MRAVSNQSRVRDPFQQQQSRAENDLEKLLKLLKTFDQHKRTEGRSRDVIQWQSQIRSSIDDLGRQLAALQKMLSAQQKGSSTSRQQEQREVIDMLQQELRNVQDYQRSGFISGYKRLVFPVHSAATLPPPAPSGRPAQQEQMTAQQQHGLQEIRCTDAVVDRELGTLSEGTAALRGLAQKQNEVVKLQGGVLDGLDSKFDSSVAQAGTVNTELKAALKIKKQKRSCDVLVTNGLCVVLALGLVALLALLLLSS